MKRAALAAFVFAAAWVACTGDDPASSNPQGAQGQECFANGTCLVGLECRSERCEVVPAGTSSGTSSGMSSGSSSSGEPFDAGPDAHVVGAFDAAACPLSTPAAGPACKAGSCAAGKTCCASGCADAGSGCGMPFWQCEAPAQCGTGKSCCVFASDTKVVDSACGTTSFTGASSECRVGSCAGAIFRACRTSNDCDAQQVCVPRKLTTAQNLSLVIGACAPKP